MFVVGIVFDFMLVKVIGKDIGDSYKQLVLGKGYDYNYVLKDQFDNILIEVVLVYDLVLGCVL